MNIGIVCYPSLGGSGIVATALGHALAREGHNIHFITYETPFKLRLEEENIYFHEVDIYQYDLFRYPDYALNLAVKIANISKEHHLDIIHVHYAIPHATSAYLAKQILGPKAPKIVTTLHGTDITLVGRDPSYFEVVKFSIENSDVVTAVSEGLKRETIEYFKIDRNIDVIHNFSKPNPEYIGKKPLRSQFAKDDEALFIHVSNFRGVKRVEDVITIFSKVRRNRPCKLILVGTGSHIDALKKLVDSLNLHDDIFFVGKQKNVDPYIASADLFLLPSAHESFGLAALESLSYGVPVIASDVCGLPEVVTHNVTGFLAPIGDTDAMARYASDILDDPKRYQIMSHAAQDDAKKRFSIGRILNQYLDIYRSEL